MSDPKITVRIDSSRPVFIEADASAFGQIFAGLNDHEQVDVLRSMVEHMKPHRMQWDYIAMALEKGENRDVRDDLSVIFPDTNTMLERLAALEAENASLLSGEYLVSVIEERERLRAELEKANNEFGSETSEWPHLWRRIADLKEYQRKAEVDNERLRKINDGVDQALKTPFCVLFLDGRNEHGSHVLSGYPRSFDVNDEDLSGQAEAILSEGEKLGFSEGSLVWANFSWVPPQIGDEGRVELDGYWDFSGINPGLSKLLEAKP